MTHSTMTRSTLKIAWLACGGVLATWLAVKPSDLPPGAALSKTADRPALSREISGSDLTMQETKLRQHASSAQLGAGTRNPFRFGGRHAESPERSEQSAAPGTPPAPPPPQQ